MFREMRRKRQVLNREEIEDILTNCHTGILSVIGDGGYPYGIPVNYVYEDDKVFIHCALTGHKIDAINSNNKVCFTVISQDEVVPQNFATNYKSVVAFGKASIVKDVIEKRYALDILVDKYSLNFKEEGNKEIDREWDIVHIIRMDFDHVSGKAAKALVK